MNEIKTVAGAVPTILNPDLFNRWIAFVDAKPQTVATYTRSIKQFAEYLQQKQITTPTRETVMSYRDDLLKDHKPTTAQNYMAAVRMFFRWTASEGLYPNISDHVKGVTLDREHKRDYLTANQSSILLKGIDTSTLIGKRDYAIIALMVTTGLRTVSIARANIEDLRTAGDCTALFYQGKGHNERAIYVKVAPPVEEAIREYLRARGKTSDSDPLFVSTSNNNNGKRLTTTSISAIAKHHLQDIGINDSRHTAHSLRHTAATLNLINGATVEETQQLLDHSNINTTMIYSHALERARNNSEQRIASAIFG